MWGQGNSPCERVSARGRSSVHLRLLHCVSELLLYKLELYAPSLTASRTPSHAPSPRCSTPSEFACSAAPSSRSTVVGRVAVASSVGHPPSVSPRLLCAPLSHAPPGPAPTAAPPAAAPAAGWCRWIDGSSCDV